MTAREKTLAIFVVVLIAAFAMRSLHNRMKATVDKRETTLQGLETTLGEREATVHRGTRAMQELQRLRKMSLPFDPADEDLGLAGSLYYRWLYEQLTAKLRLMDLTKMPVPGKNAAYEMLSYSATAAGSLESLTEFLYTFYETPFLHRISMLNATPEQADGSQLRLVIKIEALVLRDADQRDRLPEEPSRELPRPQEEYQQRIVGRNIFSPYRRPPSEPVVQKTTTPPPPKPKFDDATQAYITGITDGGGRRLMWVHERTTGKRHLLSEGDEFKIGLMEGKVIEIRPEPPREVVVESEGKRLLISLGDTMRDGRVQSAEAPQEANQLSAVQD